MSHHVYPRARAAIISSNCAERPQLGLPTQARCATCSFTRLPRRGRSPRPAVRPAGRCAAHVGGIEAAVIPGHAHQRPDLVRLGAVHRHARAGGEPERPRFHPLAQEGAHARQLILTRWPGLQPHDGRAQRRVRHQEGDVDGGAAIQALQVLRHRAPGPLNARVRPEDRPVEIAQQRGRVIGKWREADPAVAENLGGDALHHLRRVAPVRQEGNVGVGVDVDEPGCQHPPGTAPCAGPGRPPGGPPRRWSPVTATSARNTAAPCHRPPGHPGRANPRSISLLTGAAPPGSCSIRNRPSPHAGKGDAHVLRHLIRLVLRVDPHHHRVGGANVRRRRSAGHPPGRSGRRRDLIGRQGRSSSCSAATAASRSSANACSSWSAARCGRGARRLLESRPGGTLAPGSGAGLPGGRLAGGPRCQMPSPTPGSAPAAAQNFSSWPRSKCWSTTPPGCNTRARRNVSRGGCCLQRAHLGSGLRQPLDRAAFVPVRAAGA